MNSVLTAAIIGSLGCCALFVIALGCTRRLLYVQSLTSCSRARRSLQHLANILQGIIKLIFLEIINFKFARHLQHTMRQWVTSLLVSVLRDRVLGDSREMALGEKGIDFFSLTINIEFEADEHVDGASRIRTMHLSIFPPCLRSNRQSFRGNFVTRCVIKLLYPEHKAPSLLNGGRVGN